MTSTLSPDTGEIQRPRLSEDTTTDLTYAVHGPLMRRPDATGEIYQPPMPRVLDDAPVQPIAPLKRVLVADDVPVEYHDALYRSVPYVFPEGYVYRRRPGKHRATAWTRLVAFVARWVSL